MTEQAFDLQGREFVALCDLLKLAGVAHSGGEAKQLISNGQVRRNGSVETRKTAKIRAGERIECAHGSIIVVQAA